MLRRTRRVTPPPVTAAAWEITIGRLQRSVQRYYEKVAVMPDRRVRQELRELGTGMSETVDRLIAAEAADPRLGHDPVTRRVVSRAATLCAHATEAAMMASDASWHGELRDLTRCLDAVCTLVKAIRELTDSCCPRY